MQSLKDGWLIAMGKYCEVTLLIKHCKNLECYCESFLLLLSSDSSKYPKSLSILSQSGTAYSETLSSMSEGKSKDIPSGSLVQSRLILCKIPENSSCDLILNCLSEGLEISNSLGCVSACIAFEKVSKTLESSAESLVESFENYALKNLENCPCMKEVTICVQTEQEIKAVVEACKFRMTRYSVFVDIGLPQSQLMPGCVYCYSCSRVFTSGRKCHHLMSD